MNCPKNFYEQDRRKSIWPVFNVSLSASIKSCPIRPSWQPRTGQPIKQTNLADFSQYLTLWKSNCVQQITSVRAEEGVSVSSAWEINVTKSHDVSSALRHYLWSCSIGWWRFLPRCCNTSDKALAPMVLRMSLQSNRTSAYETAADKSCVQKKHKGLC